MLDRTKNENIQELAQTSCMRCRTPCGSTAGSAPIRRSATGYSVTNCYLLQAARRRLADRHRLRRRRAALRAQIESLIPRTLPLSLLPLRLNEFMSIQNIDPFTLYFNVKECFTGNPDAAFWFDFGAGSDSGQNTLDKLKITTIGREETIPIGDLGRPVVGLSGADPPDRDALDLRRGDQDAVHLRHVDAHLARPAGRPLDHPGRRRRPDRLRPRALVLLNTRYWWLEGVDTAKLRKGIDKILTKHDIETIAPGYGCILRGKKTVEKHIKLVDDVPNG